jgi:hypothetical protein
MTGTTIFSILGIIAQYQTFLDEPATLVVRTSPEAILQRAISPCEVRHRQVDLIECRAAFDMGHHPLAWAIGIRLA